ncbi:TPA: LysR family transcriptional regulator [Vibrio vulnificus]|uniref:Transcriptional regulator n=2 Tax=Vibrio vulnificus TaxID=672 RepID=A0A2S3R517_VIBVL|nr:LysR family transcriptional regulator [Vibrio vulnificus]MDK2618924.1 LysR family transcriptional regulator [Vibrio vulnificus]POB48784.1 transcriptional regulator [Vibrio vulnificus]HAS6028944.1 LysR family transcriptional regulator [Vibrio vulnificus]HAS6114446.1 LysR family transcriptional regulator [Vibrio vulnificus]HAS6123573.1 LysR family transcriptional regulator [Vibrio vulnificus]
MKDIKDLDLNLLKLLQAVVETRNTHAAADKLGISQTSVSRGMAKLRETFGDGLFIRKAHGVEPSELAEKLAEAAEEMFNPILKVVESYQSFEPEAFRGEITLAMNIYFLELYGDGLYAAFSQALPQATFKLVYWQEDSLAELLNGKIDYLIHFSAFPLPQEVYTHKLQDVKLCLVARKDHPILSQTSDWQAIHPLPIVRLAIDGINSKRVPIEELYLAKGYQANFTLVTHSVRVLSSALKHSDAILYGSNFMKVFDSQIGTFPLPAMPKEMREIAISGGYLRTKRGFPLYQLIHQTVQSYFDGVIQPEQSFDRHPSDE